MSAAHITLPLTISVVSASVDSALASSRSVFEVLVSTGGLFEAVAPDFPDFIDSGSAGDLSDLRLEAGNLLGAETVNMTALGTCEVFFHPSERYVEFVAAISRNGNVPFDLDLHGWPILSSVSATTTIAGRGDAASVSPEGPTNEGVTA